MLQETSAPQSQTIRSIRAAQAGVATNAVLALAKITAGVLGTTSALVADGVESLADVASSLIVWGGVAVAADAFHHLSDAITSAAAFIGISAALLGRHFGGGPRWAAADDWAALASSLVIARNGFTMALPALHDLMDRSPGEPVLAPLRVAALAVPGVRAIEKLAARRVGTGYRVTVHVQAAPELSLADAHSLGGRVKHAMCHAGLRIDSVLVHMEPYMDAEAGTIVQSTHHSAG